MLNLLINMSLVSLKSNYLFFTEIHRVLGSPFTVNVSGHGSSRLRESITRERRAVDITHIGSQCELSLKIPGMKRIFIE